MSEIETWLHNEIIKLEAIIAHLKAVLAHHTAASTSPDPTTASTSPDPTTPPCEPL